MSMNPRTRTITPLRLVPAIAAAAAVSVAADTPPLELADLAERWLKAKANEKRANDERLRLEAEIIRVVDNGQPAGTSNAEDRGFKIKVVRKLNRTIDMEALVPVVQQMPEDVTERLLRSKLEVVASELKWLQENRPELYRLACSAIVEKPAKPSVSVELADESTTA